MRTLRIIYYYLINKYKFLNVLFQKLKFHFRFNRRFRKTVYGFKFKGSNAMIDGNFEKKETLFFNKFILNYEVFINVGANVGYYVLNALNSNKKINIIAFEPIINNYKLLIKNVLINNYNHRVLAENIALGNENKIIEIYGNTTGASVIKGWANNPVNSFEEVKLYKLDTFLSIKKINLLGKETIMMIDVEGFELEVLKGAKSILEDVKPTLFVEICNGEHLEKNDKLFYEKFNFLNELGYESYVIDGDSLISFKPDFTKKVVTHNFIFIHKHSINYLEET